MSSALRDAAAGLLYTSEGDFPFDELTLELAGATWPVTGEQFLLIVGAPAGTEVRERTLDQFFARHIEKADPQDERMQAMRPKFVRLRELLRATLRDVHVYRVGVVEVRCYIVGAAADGKLSGLVTTALES